MKYTKRQLVAYHEAGHAVMAFELHRRIRSVSIIPQEGSLGRVEPSGKAAHLEDADFSRSTRPRYAVEIHVMLLYGGQVAEYLLTNQHPKPVISGGDDSRAFSLLLTMTHDLEEAEAYSNWLWCRTKATLRLQWNWRAVEALAEELLRSKRLGAKRVRQIIWETIHGHIAPKK